MSFKDLTTTKLGDYAEDLLIKEFSKSKNSKAYIPSSNESYPVDSICIKDSSVFGLEIKAKERMRKYDFTGFDKKDYEVYKELGIPVYVLFADYKQESIYGVWVEELKNQPNLQFGEVIVWPLTAMTFYRYMKKQEVEKFKQIANKI